MVLVEQLVILRGTLDAMNFFAWLSLVPVCLLGAMSPGPSLAVVVRHTLGGGRGKGILCAWAHSFGIGVYALVTLLGLSVILNEAPLVFKGVSIAGALFLAWLGLSAIRSKRGLAEKLAAGEATTLIVAARDGLAISILNPKIALFFLALFSQFVVEAKDMMGRMLIVLTPMVIDGLWYTVVALLLSHRWVLPRLQRNAVWVDKLSGVVLILLAIRVMWKIDWT
jgi:threonine/homoserine/homoserine lactone efflux protein